MEVYIVLTFFPKPYPDELLYSIIARFHIWSGNGEMADTMEQLFDNRRERATVLIPKHINILAEKTKKFGLNYETILFEHTIFPYITCFLNMQQFDHAFNSVIGNDQKESSFSIYKHNLNPRFLRYCPICIRDDRIDYGEAYWHRIHQTYGLSVCGKHSCYLKDSSIEIPDNRNNRYIALELLNKAMDSLDAEDISGCKNEYQIACDIDYIYKNYELIRKLMWNKYEMIREATIALLFNRGLSTQKGLVKIDRLCEEFYGRYSSLQPKQLLIDLNNDNKEHWLITLCRSSQKPVIPIRFILFADFLAGGLNQYICLILKQEKFVNNEKTVFQPPIYFEEKLIHYRERWLDAWEKNPNGHRIDLVKSDRPAYTWLRRHDNDWMQGNSPQKTKPQGTTIYKEWASIDSELLGLVEVVVNQIKNTKGKPERITKASICRHMQRKCIIERNAKSLPMTMNKINASIESTYDYRLRKIEWAKYEFDKERKPAIPWIILKKAGIRDEDWYQFMDQFTS